VSFRTAVRMDTSTEMKVMRGESWFFLFFWPAFRRVFLPGRKLEVSQERSDRCPRSAALKSKKSSEKVLEFAVPPEIIEAQIEIWIRATVESNIALAAALERICESYKLIQAGKPPEDADEILAQVEAALKDAEKTKT
jgi:hypothetical protein